MSNNKSPLPARNGREGDPLIFLNENDACFLQEYKITE
jgi:hypothetical protein